ncbi:MAG TPA: hypothetical protein VE842_01075, partial [Pyrinomonadaceae bacterium]|nr:hypothetical protein [Pyrinomonadaceae bacterium]
MSYAVTHPTDESLSVLDHDLAPFLARMVRFSSTRALEKSALYKRLGPEIERVLGSVAQEDFSSEYLSSDYLSGATTRKRRAAASYVRATAWNIERGIRLPSIIGV